MKGNSPKTLNAMQTSCKIMFELVSLLYVGYSKCK